MSYKFSIFINNCNCNDIVVGIDLVHESSHYTDSVSVLNQLLLLLFASLISLLFNIILEVTMHSKAFSGERPSHQGLFVGLFASSNHKAFSLLFYLCSKFFYDLFDKKLFNQHVDGLSAQDIVLVSVALRILHIKTLQEVFEIVKLSLFHCNFDCNQASFLTLQNVEEKIILIAQLIQWHLLYKFDTIARMEKVQVFLALFSEFRG